MKIILFEFRKNILRKPVILPVVILMAVNMIVIYAQYRFNNDVFSSEVNVYNSSAKEWNYYKKLHAQFDGEITEEKQEKIIRLYDHLKEKDGKGDFNLVESDFYLPVKNLVSYAEKNNKLVNQAKKNIKFYRKAGNKYEVGKNQYIVKQYQNRALYTFYDTTGWKKIFDYNFSDIVLIIMLFLCILPLFHQERLWGMENIILTTKKGGKMYLVGKYISVIAGMIMCTVLVAGINYFMFYIIYGLNGSGMPVYTLEEFWYSPCNLTLLQTYFLIQILKSAALIVVSTFMCLAANIIKNTMLSFVVFIGVIAGCLYCSGYVCSDNLQKVMIAIASPFSLFKCPDIFKSLYEINLFGTFELRVYVCIIVQVIVEVLLIGISYYKYKCFNGRKGSFGQKIC